VIVVLAVGLGWWLKRPAPPGPARPTDTRTSDASSALPAVSTPPPAPHVEESAPAVDTATPAPTATLSASTSASAKVPPPDHSAVVKDAGPPPDDSGPLSARIMRALEAHQNTKAVRLANELTGQAPGSATAWHLRGAAEQAAGGSGKSSFKRCADLAPADSPIGAECRALAGN
jgi:hypothetical protein